MYEILLWQWNSRHGDYTNHRETFKDVTDEQLIHLMKHADKTKNALGKYTGEYLYEVYSADGEICIDFIFTDNGELIWQ